MSTFRIPNSTGGIRSTGRTENRGELYETFNVDINNPYGKIKSSNALQKILDETDMGNDRVQALAVYHKTDSILAPKYYAVTDSAVMTCPTTDDPTDSDNWSEETGIATSGFGDETDAVVFNDLLLISRSQDILSWNEGTDDNNWWTTVFSGPSLSSGYPHIMHVHRGGAETLFVTDKNEVHYANTSAGHSKVTLGTNLVATCITSGVDAIWVGTYSESNEYAYVYEIYIGQVSDNGTPIANRAFRIDAKAVLSIDVIDNVPYIVTEKGNIQAFNGSGFVTVASLPFAGTSTVLDNVRIGNIDEDNNQRPVHPKGMRAHNDSLFIQYNTTTENLGFSQFPYAKRSPSGVYEYNVTTGQVHHRFAIANSATQDGSKVWSYTGPLMIIDTPYTLLMVGAEVDNTTAGLYMEQSNTFGYFVTSEIDSGSIQDALEAVYMKAKTLASGESIELKYRTEKRDDIFCDAVLASATEIHTTDDITGVEVGDEVTGLDDDLAGKTAHIVSIDTSSDTVTVLTVDTDMGSANDTGVIEIQNFKPMGYDYREDTYNTANKVTYTSTDGEVKRFGEFGTNTWIQYKVYFNGSIELREFISKGNSKQEL